VTTANAESLVTDIVAGVVTATAMVALELEAAFVYGSVARGTATPASDIDTFLLVRSELDAAQRDGLDAAFTRLQHEFGCRPDPDHPVEIFAVGTCERALAGPLVLRSVDTAARGGTLDQPTHDSDDLELLRALLDSRLPVIESLVLDSLTAIARHRVTTAARHHGVVETDLLPCLGLASGIRRP